MGAFQQPAPADVVVATARRAPGGRTVVLRAVELSLGIHNTTYRLDLAEVPAVVLRVAPEAGRGDVARGSLRT